MKRQHVDEKVNSSLKVQSIINKYYHPKNKSLVLDFNGLDSNDIENLNNANLEVETLKILTSHSTRNNYDEKISINNKIKLLAKFIIGHPNLKTLDLSGIDISDEIMTDESLAVFSNALAGSGIKNIKFDGANTKLKNNNYHYIHSNNTTINYYIGSKILRSLAKPNILDNVDSISFVNCNICENDNGAKALASFINACPNIKELNLTANKIKDKGLKIIANSLTNTTLQTIILDSNKITSEGVKSLARALKAENSIEKISLYNNEIEDNGVIILLSSLKTNTKVKNINLAKNKIGDNGAKALADLLTLNTNLICIDIGNNNIKDQGLKNIANALRVNTNLEGINIQKNKKIKNFHLFVDAIKVNENITFLDLSKNKILGNEVSEIIKVNTSLNSLALTSCGIKDASAEQISQAIKSNSTLTTLDLSHNTITTKGIKLFAASPNETLEVNFNGNDYDKKGVQALAMRDRHLHK